MKRIYKNTDLNFPISLLPVTENEELVVKFFTRSDKQFIQKTNDDIVDNHIMLAWSELETLDEGVLNIWTLVSSHDSNLDDNSYDVAEISNTPYYIVTNQKSEWDDDIANTILNNYYTKSEVDEKLSNLDVDVDLSQYALQSDLLELSGGVIDNEAVIAAALTELKETKLDKTEVPSLDGYATESWVTEQINNVDVSDELQNYYTKDEVDEAIKNAVVDLTGYATESWVNEQIEKIDVTDQLDNYYTKDEVDNAIEESEVDLTGFCYKQILTQAEYDALEKKDPQTIYIISDAPSTGGDTIITGADIAILKYNHQTNVFDGDFNATLEAIKDTTKPFAIYLPFGTSEYLQASYIMPAGTQIYAISDIYSSSRIVHYIFCINADGSYTKQEENIALGGGSSGNVDLTNYYTKSEVDEAIQNVEVDLTDYYTKDEVDDKVANVTIDLTGYATEQWVEDKDYINHVAITKEEYDAITPEENTMYIITDILDEWVGTQAEFDALPTKNPDTTYYITE